MCAMTTPGPPVGRLGATSIDCPDPAALADFYAALLGMRRLVEAPDGSVVAITDGTGVLAFMRVADYVAPTWPEPGQLQQMHLDVSVDDITDAVAQAVALGAREAAHQQAPSLWRVMLDPVGHPFCLTTVTPD
jgi:catechol 2,3-dioxygenase-like lactoylglutathione lyase family enzyme